MNSFILESNGQKNFFICPCCKNKISSDNNISSSKIYVFHSYSEAIQHGWRLVQDIKFCPPEFVEEGVWICPECAKNCLEQT